MRICLYSEKALPKVGGQELVVDSLARKLLAWGHEPVVLAPWRREKAVWHDNNLPYRVVRHPRFFSTRHFVELYGWWLSRAHRRYRFDLLHCHGVYPTGYIAAKCASVAEIPVVITSHGGDLDAVSPLYRKRGLKHRYHYALKKASAVVALSGFVEGRLREICPEIRRVERIGNGVNLQEFDMARQRRLAGLSGAQAGKYFLFLGRLVPRKGADLLVEAFSRIKKRSGISLVIAGVGRQEPSLRARVAELGLENRVKFVGEVGGPNKICLLRGALCVVMPSRISEAFGLVALEGFAAGRPVIATNIPGLCELVTPNKTGMLVGEDSAEELARALDAAATRPDLMERLGNEAHRQVRGHGWDNVAWRHVELYEDLIGRLTLQKTA